MNSYQILIFRKQNKDDDSPDRHFNAFCLSLSTEWNIKELQKDFEIRTVEGKIWMEFDDFLMRYFGAKLVDFGEYYV